MEITDVYANIADAINEDNKVCIDHIFEAMKELNINPKDIAMRGGTDGSFISTKGIPTLTTSLVLITSTLCRIHAYGCSGKKLSHDLKS